MRCQEKTHRAVPRGLKLIFGDFALYPLLDFRAGGLANRADLFQEILMSALRAVIELEPDGYFSYLS